MLKCELYYMTKVIEAVYKHGVFKPLEKVDLPEDTKLKIKIEAIKPAGILKIAKKFRKEIDTENIKEDPLQVLLKMRDRI